MLNHHFRIRTAAFCFVPLVACSDEGDPRRLPTTERDAESDRGADVTAGASGRGGSAGSAAAAGGRDAGDSGAAGSAGASGMAGSSGGNADASVDGVGGTAGLDGAPDGGVLDAGDAAESGIAPVLTNLPGSALCSAGGGLSFVAVATGTGPIAFSQANGSTCAFPVTVNSDGSITATCPSATATCTLQIQATNALGSSAGTLTVEVVQPGLDVGWGTNGCVRYDGGGRDMGWSFDFDSSGRIVVVGQSAPAGVGEAILALWRLNPDGQLDAGFGTAGLATYTGQAAGAGQELGMDVVVDSDGYFVSGFALRGTGSSPDNRDAAFWKFSTAGQLDSSFNSSGFYTARPYANRNELHDIALLRVAGQRRIAAAGLGRANPNWNLIAYLLDDSGQPDPAFDGDGFLGWRAGATTAGRTLTVQRDAAQDRILIAGNIIAGRDSMFVQRYTAAGQRDPTFGTSCVGGAVNEPNTSCWIDATSESGGEDVIVDRQGRILVVGGVETAANVYDSMAWRLTPNGLPDTSFGAQSGEWWRRWNSGQSEYALGAAVDDRGRVIVVGSLGVTHTSTTADSFVARYTDSGALDPSFGTGGIVTLTAVAGGTGEDRAIHIKTGPLGRYYAAGYSTNAAGDFDMFVCRLNP